MKTATKVLSYILMAAGLGIVIAIFYVFLYDQFTEETINKFYLSLIASCIVYLLVILRATDIFASVGAVARKGSGYGFFWTGMWIYVPLAVVTIIVTLIGIMGFNLALMVHLILLFGLLGMFLLGYLTQGNVNSVMQAIDARNSGLKNINSQLSLLEIALKTHSRDNFTETLEEIQDGVRMITASDNPAAIDLEGCLYSKLMLMTDNVNGSVTEDEVLRKDFEECMALISLRKKNN